MKRIQIATFALLSAAIVSSQVRASQFTWNNTGSDYNTATNWTPATVPSGNSVAVFTGAGSNLTLPTLSASVSVSGLFFNNATNYFFKSAAGLTITFTGETTTPGSEASNTTACAIAATNTTGNDDVVADIVLAPFGSNQLSTFYQTTGGTLYVDGNVSGVNITLELNSNQTSGATPGGNFIMRGRNSYSGDTIITGGSAATVTVIGNSGANGNLGAGTTIDLGGGNGRGTLVYTGIGENTSKIINLAGTTGGATIDQSGAGLLNFTGTNTATGSGTKTLTLQGSTSGTGQISGSIVNGPTGSVALLKAGTGTWTLSGTNSYSGGTTVAGGTLLATAAGALGTGNVSLGAGAVTLTLGNGGVGQQYISSTATFSIAIGNTVNLNYTGTNAINSLVVDGTPVAPGIYGAAINNPDNIFKGTGTITVAPIPEPATYMLMGMGLLICAQTFRRKRS